MQHPTKPIVLATLTAACLAAAVQAQSGRHIVIQRTPEAAAAPPSTKIPISTLPFDIDEPGSYYVTQDLDATPGQRGISIECDDVTIDLCGFTLRGNSAGTLGILAGTPNIDNVCIHGGIVRGWQQSGISLDIAEHISLRDLKLIGNGVAGAVVGDQFTIRNVVATGNILAGIIARRNGTMAECVVEGSGTGISCGNGTALRDCVARNNRGVGVSAGAYCTLFRCSVAGGSFAGFDLGRGSSLTGCVVSGVSGSGFVQKDLEDGVTMQGCSARQNTQDGFDVGRGSALTGCSAVANGGDGYDCGEGSTLSDCSAHRNVGHGFVLASEVSIEGCNASFNTLHGIHTGDRCRIVGNTATRNGFVNPVAAPVPGSVSAGISTDGTGCAIESNVVTANDRGVLVQGQRNCVVKNRASQNAVDFDIVPGNTVGQVMNLINIGGANTVNDLANVRH